jgi:glycosyltransferase involved in cell wall biosynthesis
MTFNDYDHLLGQGSSPTAGAISTINRPQETLTSVDAHDDASADLITVCIPTHRRPLLLMQTLRSCFEQDYRPLEIDVADDSPGDETEALVKELTIPAGITLRYRHNRLSLGQAGNVNGLFARARGKRLVLMHDDDRLLPGAISAMAQAWSIVPDVVVVYGRQEILCNNGDVDEAETEFKAWYYKRDTAHAGEQRNLLVSAFWRQFPNNGYLIETEAARRAGYRPFAEVGHACDTDFSIRLAMNSRGRCFYMIDRLTSQYRNNIDSLSRTVDVTWKFYDYLLGLSGLDPTEAEARDMLLRELAAQATKENALRGRRVAALKIFFSRFYPRDQRLIKSLYHLGLTVTPRLHNLRRFKRVAALCSPTPPLQAPSTGTTVGTAPWEGRSSTFEVGRHGAHALTITLVSQEVRYGHGQGRANLELIREALRRGNRVNIIASDVDAAICNDPNVTLHLLDVRSIPTQLLRDAIFDFRAQKVLRHLRSESDIIHVNGAVVTTSSDVNTAHFIHGSNAKFQPNRFRMLASPYHLYQFGYTLLNTIMERRCFRRARAVIAVSQNVAADLVAAGVDRSKVFVVYNGIDLEEFRPGTEDRVRLGLPADVPRGIFVGDIKGRRKNLDTVLKAMISVPDLHLAVLASYARTQAPALAATLGIAERVHFIGERSDVAAVMRSADMLIFPSRYEPFGMVILEALASGLPVIASRAAGASELIEPGCGVIVEDANNVQELANAIHLLTSDQEMRTEMAKRGRGIAEKYSWERMARSYMARYDNLTSGRTSRAIAAQSTGGTMSEPADPAGERTHV